MRLPVGPPRPFDFVVAGQLLRQPLEALLMDLNLSAELGPDRYAAWAMGSAGATTWGGGGQGGSRSYILTQALTLPLTLALALTLPLALALTLAPGEGPRCTHSWTAHPGGVNTVASAALQLPGRKQAVQLVASGGKDHAVCLWQVDHASDPSPTHHLLASCRGHTDSVECVALSPDTQHLASCGWDGALLVWRAGQAVVDAAAEAAAVAKAGGGRGAVGPAAAAPAPVAKRRKGGQGGGGGTAAEGVAPEGGVQEEVQARLQGHIHCVAGVAWATQGLLFSGGWDHSVRRWDLATTINTDTYSGSKAVCCVACPPPALQGANAAPGSLVAFGCSDKAVRLWDSRTRSGEALAVKGLVGHAGWVTSLAWCPSSPFHLASGSHDHTMKLWDLRSTVPLCTLASHSDKVLAVGWAGPQAVLSGGADCQLHLHSCTVAPT
ncbi:hypothetical protein QJQ45_012237 [Haematococcus lacustris]|nr:hypothetical protein QJQ45_012237 [Haematococcus lacustris]